MFISAKNNIILDQVLELLDNCMCLQLDNNLYDIGCIGENDIFSHIIDLCMKKDLIIDYPYNQSYKTDIFSESKFVQDMYNISIQYKIKDNINKIKHRYKYPVGILPYKLMNVFITPVEKQHNFIEDNNLQSKAKTIIEFIKENNGNTNKLEITRKIKKLDI
jgi:hypothetical protein